MLDQQAELQGGKSPPSARSLRGLDGINCLMANVRDGIGPSLSIYLSGSRDWQAGPIGVAMAISNLAAAPCQVLAGLLVDASRAKRLLITAAALIVGLGCLSIVFYPEGFVIYAAQAGAGAALAVIPPAIAAISLGIVGRAMDKGIGRKTIFLVALVVLPIRGLLFTVTSNPFGIVGIQLLDGVGAALSNTVAGYIVQLFGFSTGFLFPAGVAGAALALFRVFMPETGEAEPADRPADAAVQQAG